MAPGSSPQQVVEREISSVPIRGADDRVADGLRARVCRGRNAFCFTASRRTQIRSKSHS